jgi:hypothetical protein
MILKDWPFELLNGEIKPDGPPDDGGGAGIPH